MGYAELFDYDSDALLHAFCNLSLAFMTDFKLSDKTTRNGFTALAGKVCSICCLARNTCWQDLHTFSLIGTTALHCGQTLLGGMTNGNSRNSQPPSALHRNWEEMAASVHHHTW